MNNCLVVNLDDERFTAFPFSVGCLILKFVFGERDSVPLIQLKISKDEAELVNTSTHLTNFIFINSGPVHSYNHLMETIRFQPYGKAELEALNLSIQVFPNVKLKIGRFQESGEIFDVASVWFHEEEIAVVEDPNFSNSIRTIPQINRHAIEELKRWGLWQQYSEFNSLHEDLFH